MSDRRCLTLREILERYWEDQLCLRELGQKYGTQGHAGVQHELTRAADLLAVVRDAILAAALELEN